MNILFLTYDIVASYEHDREHVSACEGTPLSVQPDGGLNLSLCQLYFRGGEVPIRQRGPVHHVHRHRCNRTR